MSLKNMRDRLAKIPPPAPPPGRGGKSGDTMEPYREYARWLEAGARGECPVPPLAEYADAFRRLEGRKVRAGEGD